MGITDHWRGDCPHCHKRFDCDEQGHLYSPMQTKIFKNPYGRDFFPGYELPEFPGAKLYIGDCTHCTKPIYVVTRVHRDLKKAKMIADWREANKSSRFLPKELRDNGTRYILDHYE